MKQNAIPFPDSEDISCAEIASLKAEIEKLRGDIRTIQKLAHNAFVGDADESAACCNINNICLAALGNGEKK
jgi:hypothetical protein